MPSKRSIQSYLIEFNITEDYLRDAYLTRELSLPDIRKEKGIGFKACAKLIRYFKIPIRTISDSKKLDRCLKKVRFNCLNKYGVENPSQIEIVKEKKRCTFKKHYGVDNIWKSKEYYKWLNDYMLKTYGCLRISNQPFLDGTLSKNWWKNAPAEVREKKIRKQIQNLHKVSSFKNGIELMIADALDELKISYQRFYPVERYVADFYIKQFNLIIECNGDFWHANPKKYKKDGVLKFPNTKGVIAEDLWKKDKRKIDKYKNLSYNILVIWESDIKKLHKNGKLFEFLMQAIKNEIGLEKL